MKKLSSFKQHKVESATNHVLKIATIVPIYKAEKFISETLESIIAQSIGFKQNIRIILVDDGSPDNSAKICKRYVEAYPDNIDYIHQSNAGVSAARNRGLSEVASSCSYVHFLDSDDIISEDFYAQGVRFLETHKNVDFVAPKIKFFDANIDEHPNNYKFKSTRVIDVTKEADTPIMHVSSCLFTFDSTRGVIFDTQLKIAEDAKFVHDVLWKKKKYGVLAEACLHYRKRSDGSSAINGQYSQKEFYTVTPIRFLEYLLVTWRDAHGRPIDYAQNVVLYDLMWRLGQSEPGVLSKKETAVYTEVIKQLIMQIDDKNIISKKGISLPKKLYMLKVKHGSDWGRSVVAQKGMYKVSNEVISQAADDTVHLDFIHTSPDVMSIEGYSKRGVIIDGDKIIVRANGVEYDATWVERPTRRITFLRDEIYSGGAFEVTLPTPVSPKYEIEFFRLLPDGSEAKLSVHTGRFTRLSSLRFSYSNRKNITLRREQGRLHVYQKNWRNTLRFEFVYLGIILLNWKLQIMKDRLIKLKRYNLRFLSPKQKMFEFVKPFAFSMEAIAMIPKAIALRTLVRVAEPFIKKNGNQIWIISDRAMAAGDNGEAFYRYILKKKEVHPKVYFAIARKSEDYGRIAGLGGRVLRHGNIKHQFMFLLADKIISSHADIETTNPYLRQLDHYIDILNFDFIFLQHGIIRHDLSRWLNRFEKNISLFVTSAEAEYQSILRLPYGYKQQQLVLSGMPRYDLLESKPQNKIILAPTYRKGILRNKTNKRGERKYDPSFKSSDFRKFYNSFINDERLIRLLKENNLIGELYLHPNLAAQTRDFNGNNHFAIKQYPYCYKEAFKVGNIFISDYSSTVFDFAFLKKPIVYAQFDREEFYKDHGYGEDNYFADEKDGFGAVVNTCEELVDEVQRLIEDGCKMDTAYRQRVDSFYRWHDRRSSERVYTAVLAMDNDLKA